MNQVNQTPVDQSQNSQDEDYSLIEQALIQNPRGRWFLEEYLKRNRPADTQQLLGAIQRIEQSLQKQKPEATDLDPIRMSIIEMSKAIAKTREEINSIKPDNENDNQLINATEELSAIVESTETATNTILEAAEEIQESAWTMREAGADGDCCDKIDEKTTEIYTACSFQDITGQRTTKVVQALAYIENRVNAMIDIWGLDEFAANHSPIEENNDQRPDAHLLHGPAKLGEGVQQDGVDDMMANASSEEDTQDLADTMSFDQIDNQEISAADLDEMSFDAISTDEDNLESADVSVCDLDDIANAADPEALNPLEEMAVLDDVDLGDPVEEVMGVAMVDASPEISEAAANGEALMATPTEETTSFVEDARPECDEDKADDLMAEAQISAEDALSQDALSQAELDDANIDIDNFEMAAGDEASMAEAVAFGVEGQEAVQDELEGFSEADALAPDADLAAFAENVLTDGAAPADLTEQDDDMTSLEQQDSLAVAAEAPLAEPTEVADIDPLDAEELSVEQKETLLS